MSEEKIIKHTQKAIHIAADKEKSWLKKIQELAEEVAIIVFAVSITLAFHNWNDRRNEHQIERQFLEGASADLKREAKEIYGSQDMLKEISAYYDNVWHQMATGKINKGYIDSNSYELINTSFLDFPNGRFESFKSSGYLRLIENKTLLLHITDLYTSFMPFEIKIDDEFYNAQRNLYNTYIGAKAPVDSSGIEHVSQIINDPAVRHFFSFYSSYMHERIKHKIKLADSMKKLADEIDKELNK